MSASSQTRGRGRLGPMAAAVIVLSLGLSFAAVGARAAPSTDFRADVGAQPPRQTIILDGVSIAYSDTGGTGPVLIGLHAIGHGARDYQDLSRRLSPQYRVIAIDFPGQGNSGPDPQPASGTRYTQLLTLFIDKLNLHAVTLIGNSIGGATSVRYASLHPERVKALVLCDSGGLGGPPDAQSKAFIDHFAQFFATGVHGDPAFGPAFAKYYSSVLIAEPARAERERIVRSAYEIAPVLQQAWESFGRPEESLWAVLPQIHCPVLLAWAKDDQIVSLASNRPAFERFPNHHLEVFAGGHAAFLEDPDRFEEKLRQFLETLPAN